MPMVGVKKIELQKKARRLVVDFNDGRRVMISFSDLRAHSPSAENQAQLVATYPDIDIVSLQPVGNYAVRPIFSDGHQSGIYSWDTLRALGDMAKQ